MVGNLGQQMGQGLMGQPGVANPTVYSLAQSQLANAQSQYTNQQLGLSSLQVGD